MLVDTRKILCSLSSFLYCPLIDFVLNPQSKTKLVRFGFFNGITKEVSWMDGQAPIGRQKDIHAKRPNVESEDKTGGCKHRFSGEMCTNELARQNGTNIHNREFVSLIRSLQNTPA
jgi:hypothetical protein